MDLNTEKITREALTRELEHHIEDLCDDIIDRLSYIKDNSNVHEDNFESMSYLGEALERLNTQSNNTLAYLLKLQSVEKIASTIYKFNII